VPRVLVAGTWDEGPGYPRTRTILAALLELGVVVHQLRVPLPALGVTRSRFLRSPWRWPGFALRLWRTRTVFRARLREAVRKSRFDAVLVPYPGHFAVRWVRGVCDMPIALDMFLSAHGTAVVDRALFPPGSAAARALLRIDRTACAAADLVLLDTQDHAAVVAESVGLGEFDWIPIGDPQPPERGLPLPPAAQRLRLLFFGTGVTLHGLRTITDAVARCEEVELTLVGGSDAERAHARRVIPAERLVLGAVFEEPARLRDRIAACDVVAGIFGTSQKARAVIPYKVVHALAAGRPVVTGDTPAVRRMLDVGTECVVCAPGDADALAVTLRELARDRERLPRLGRAARAAFDATFSTECCARRLAGVLARLGVSIPAPTKAALV
jgi:glycosyltransferase involved in cell wall biosynthesis